MEKHVYPVCRESEINVNIQDDNWKGDCKINRKRVDMQWGEWGEREISKDNGHKYQEVKRRPVEVPNAHGGIAYKANEQVFFLIFNTQFQILTSFLVCFWNGFFLITQKLNFG